MYSRETRVLLRHYLEQGVGKTELARRFGVSRPQVVRVLDRAVEASLVMKQLSTGEDRAACSSYYFLA